MGCLAVAGPRSGSSSPPRATPASWAASSRPWARRRSSSRRRVRRPRRRSRARRRGGRARRKRRPQRGWAAVGHRSQAVGISLSLFRALAYFWAPLVSRWVRRSRGLTEVLVPNVIELAELAAWHCFFRCTAGSGLPWGLAQAAVRQTPGETVQPVTMGRPSTWTDDYLTAAASAVFWRGDPRSMRESEELRGSRCDAGGVLGVTRIWAALPGSPMAAGNQPGCSRPGLRC
jgi:hypothetical protein